MVNRKSAVVITLLIILGIFSFPLFSPPVEAESSTQIDIKPSKDHLEVNENFYATISIAPDEPIISVQVDLFFDATLLQCDSVSNGNTSAWQFFEPGIIDNTNGEITGVCVTNMGGTVTNPTDCFNITFTAQYTDGTSTLDIHNVGMSNGTGAAIPSGQITVNDGIVTIGAGAPPVFSSENPSDGATDVSIDLSELNVTIEDQEGDNFDWYIETNPDIGNDSNSDDSNGTKICSISGLDYDTSYTWYVNAVDSGGSIWANQTFTFTTESNPDQGSTGGGTGGGTDEGGDKEEVEANFSWTKDGLTVNFEDKSKGSVSKWSWDFNGDQEIDSNQQNPTYKYKKGGTYQVTLKVSSDESQDTTTKNVLVFVGNYPPSKPTLKGKETGIQNKQYIYSAKSTDQDGHFIKYTFNWGDGTTTTTEYLASGTEVEKTHKWTNAGKYQIWVQATDDYNNDKWASY